MCYEGIFRIFKKRKNPNSHPQEKKRKEKKNPSFSVL